VRIAVLNGPNLNLLGTREPDVYGRETLAGVEQQIRAEAARLGVEIGFSQTNHEGQFVELIQGLRGSAEGAIVNAGAFTHTSLAIRDAMLAVKVPFVEVHLSNIFAREEIRRHSLLADLALGVVAGFGVRSYLLGLSAVVAHLKGRVS
jgi:3-dehydroquinate dehydratase-2